MHFFNYYNYYVGSYYPKESLLAGQLLIKQVEHYQDYEKRLTLAKKFIEAAADNIYRNLRYYKAREISSYLYDQTSSCTNETEETVLANDISLLEKKKLSTFPRQRKQIYYLTRFKGLSSVEIATRLNVGKRTVECHLFMARKEMRTYLQQCI